MNWHERINRTEQRGRFTEFDISLAASWVTCACGEQDTRIPRYGSTTVTYSEFEPTDEILSTSGKLFFSAVMNNEFERSRKVLAAIETRSSEILAELAA